MHDRQSTPDILGNIMSGTVAKKTILPEITNVIKQESKKAIQPQDCAEEELKEKATFNLPVDLLSELEDKCHEIRKFLRSKQVSKTLLVEEALKMAFEDFDSRKQASKFFSRLARNKAIKPPLS